MRSLALLATLLVLALSSAQAQPQDTLSTIKARGTIIVGIKNDYKPWGFLDPSGKVVGLEVDLVDDVARKLGVKTELVPVTAANRMEFLRQSRIDMIVATMGDTPDRRKVIGMVEPNYYAGGTNVMAPKSAHFTKWDDLRGRKICAVQGAYYNRRVTQLYGPELVVFPAVPDAMTAMAGGNCAGFLFDDTLIQSTLAARDPKWADYEMPLKSEDPQLWAIGIRLEDVNAPFGKLLTDLSAEWHRSGRLLELEKKWGLEASPYLLATREKLSHQ